MILNRACIPQVTVFGQSAGAVSVALLYLTKSFSKLARAAVCIPVNLNSSLFNRETDLRIGGGWDNWNIRRQQIAGTVEYLCQQYPDMRGEFKRPVLLPPCSDNRPTSSCRERRSRGYCRRISVLPCAGWARRHNSRASK